MHAIKGGWVGQTFALAKCNDSRGKKSRIRRSKEERKALVESFIKKYQKLNNGSFPSLNLTHKEVGGSFYTVREIVREVIQENRVLGPAKITTDEQNLDWFLEEYPLGTISIEPETGLSSPNGSHIVTHIVPNHHQDTSEELVLDSSVQCPEPEHQRFDEAQIINGSSQVVEKNEEYDKAISTESRARECLELDENVAELEASKAKVTHVAADVMVEKFPLTSGSRITYGLEEKYSEPSEMTGNLVKEIEKVETEASNNGSVEDEMNFVESSSVLGNGKAEANIAGPLLEKSRGLVDEKPVDNLEATLLENTDDSTTIEITILDTNNGIDPEGEDDASPAGTKVTVNGTDPLNLNVTITSDSPEQSTSTKDIEHGGNPKHGGSSLKESNPTLNRMNLESWETTSKKPAKPETNPLLAVFKSFFAAFVKFWSE